MNGRIIILEGNISAGKSTLAGRLGKQLGYRVFFEPTTTNPYLERYYKEPKVWGFEMQMWLLRQRFDTFIEALKYNVTTGNGVILDRSVWSDMVFAQKNHMDGNITDAQYAEYQAVRERMVAHLEAPHIVLYLDVSPEECFYRIHKVRGRACESGIPLEYLQGLDICYRNFLVDMSKRGSAIVRVPWENFGSESELATSVRGVELSPRSQRIAMSYLNSLASRNFETTSVAAAASA